MRLVVGLGNPGERYRRTRHNIGFMVVDALASRAAAGRWRTEHEAWVAEAVFDDEKLLLVKPQTYMNRSGAAVAPLLDGHGGGLMDLLVVVDDVALPLTTLRIRSRGSHGGHNGLRSIVDTLGADEFARLRIGVRRGDLPEDLAEYVLSPFEEEEVLIVQEVVGRAADAVECILLDGVQAAMNRFNRAGPL
ncbi:MAG: aminoacyl-tRNA hydrolase [Vicinamibacteria bacterium]|nr:aminoacyl-tRNA hydrolase [Vicinamibacteria bacterium]